MAFLAKDEDGSEWIYQDKPVKCNDKWLGNFEDPSIHIPKGSIQKLIGRELKWGDKPVEI